VAGIGTALAFEPALPNIWRDNAHFEPKIPQVNWKSKPISALATMAIIRRQLQRMGKGKLPQKNSSAVFSLIRDRIRFKKLTKQYRARHATEIN